MNFRLRNWRVSVSQHRRQHGAMPEWTEPGPGNPAAAFTLQGAGVSPGLQSPLLSSPSTSLYPRNPPLSCTSLCPPAGLLACVCVCRPGPRLELPSPWAQPHPQGQGPGLANPSRLPQAPSGSSRYSTITVPAGATGLPPMCVCLGFSTGPLGSRHMAEGPGRHPTSPTFSQHIASGPCKVDVCLMVRAPTRALTVPFRGTISSQALLINSLLGPTPPDRGTCATLGHASASLLTETELILTGCAQGTDRGVRRWRGTAGLETQVLSPSNRGLQLLPDCEGGNCVKEDVLSRLTGGQ